MRVIAAPEYPASVITTAFQSAPTSLSQIADVAHYAEPNTLLQKQIMGIKTGICVLRETSQQP